MRSSELICLCTNQLSNTMRSPTDCGDKVQTKSVLRQLLNVSCCCAVNAAQCGEAPSRSMLYSTSDSSGAERSGVRSFVTNIKQTGWGLSESYPQGQNGARFWWALCLVIVSMSPTIFRRQQHGDKQIKQLFDAAALFLCDTLTPVLLLAWRVIQQGGMPAVPVRC